MYLIIFVKHFGSKKGRLRLKLKAEILNCSVFRNSEQDNSPLINLCTKAMSLDKLNGFKPNALSIIFKGQRDIHLTKSIYYTPRFFQACR